MTRFSSAGGQTCVDGCDGFAKHAHSLGSAGFHRFNEQHGDIRVGRKRLGLAHKGVFSQLGLTERCMGFDDVGQGPHVFERHALLYSPLMQFVYEMVECAEDFAERYGGLKQQLAWAELPWGDLVWLHGMTSVLQHAG